MQMGGQLLQCNGGIIFLYIQQNLMVTVAQRNDLGGRLPVLGKAQQQDHQHTCQDTVRIVVGGEHFTEHIEDVSPYFRIVSGAKEQILFAVFIIDTAEQKTT